MKNNMYINEIFTIFHHIYSLYFLLCGTKWKTERKFTSEAISFVPKRSSLSAPFQRPQRR